MFAQIYEVDQRRPNEALEIFFTSDYFNTLFVTTFLYICSP